MKIPKTILVAALTMTICATAYADDSSTGDLPLEQDQIGQASQQPTELDTGDVAREIMGGKILNKEDGSEIYVECVRTNATGACEAVHYVLQRGFATTALTSDIEMKDVMALLDTMDHDFTDNAAKSAKTHHSAFAHPKLYPVTREIYGHTLKVGDTIDIFGDSTWGAALVGLGGLIFGGPVVAIAGGAAVVGIWGFPIIADTAILPFQLLWVPLQDVSDEIKNLIVDGKFRRQAKRLARAFALTTKEGNRETRLRDDDFQLLVSLLQSSSHK